MNILVTSSTGFIGYQLEKRLIKVSQNNVIGLDNINDYYDLRMKYGRLVDCGIRMPNISTPRSV